MQTRIDEIGADMYCLSIFAPEVAPPQGLTFNHFLITGDEPLLFSLREAKNVSLSFRCRCPDHSTGAVALACFRTF